jgi:hypothetical protein
MRDIAIIERPAECRAIQPGQIWLAEQLGTILHPLDREALADANVVIYERSLAPLVAQALPLGAYAEPLRRTALPGVISPRSLRFAAEGWSVVQLSETRIADAALALLRSGIRGDLPVTRIAKPLTRAASLDLRSLRDLTQLALPEDAHGDPLTLVFGPFAGSYPVGVVGHSQFFTAHGLAG